MSYHVILPLLFISTLLTFNILERLSDKKYAPIHPFARQRAPPPDNTQESAEELLGDYHPEYQQILKLRKRLAETDSPSEFVEHTRIERNLIKLEKQFRTTLAEMDPENRAKHEAHINRPTHQASPAPSSTGSPTGPSLFASAFSVPQVKGFNAALPICKFIVLWLLIHCVVGWSPSINSCPLFPYPAALFWPLVSADTGRPRFPLSLFMNASIDPNLMAEVNSKYGAVVPELPGGGVLVSFGFATTMYIINRGIGRFSGLLLNRSTSCFHQLYNFSKKT